MTRQFALPDLGEGLTEAEVVRWLVDVGDAVVTDQPIVEVETAKTTVEIPCPHAGVVTIRHAEAGQLVNVGAPLVTVASRDGQEGGAGHEGSGNVLVGYGTGATGRRRRRRRQNAVARPQPEAQAEATRASGPQSAGPVPVVSPLVRRLARQHGVDLRALTGSGPGGLVLRRDVRAAAGTTTAAGTEPGRRIPLRGAMAKAVTTSRREIPESTVWLDVDATEFVAARAEINAEARDGKQRLGTQALLGRFCVLALAAFPELNARVDTQARELVLNQSVHLGFATRTPHGLVVPVVRDAQAMSARRLSDAARELIEAARAGTLEPKRLTGGTFTVNNYGPLGVDGSAQIINYPQAAIVGLGRIADRPWVVAGELAVRKVTQLTLVFDHRVCDGETAAGFLTYVAGCLEHPARLIAEL